jgi:hypothetical protein
MPRKDAAAWCYVSCSGVEQFATNADQVRHVLKKAGTNFFWKPTSRVVADAGLSVLLIHNKESAKRADIILLRKLCPYLTTQTCTFCVKGFSSSVGKTWRTTFGDIMSVLNPQVILCQKCHLNMTPIFSWYGAKKIKWIENHKSRLQTYVLQREGAPHTSVDTWRNTWIISSLAGGLVVVVGRIGHCGHRTSFPIDLHVWGTWKTWCMNAK